MNANNVFDFFDDPYKADPVGGCDHERMVFEPNVLKCNDTPVRRFTMRGYCPDCRWTMQFVGVPHDRPPTEASTTPAADEVFISFMMVPPVEEPLCSAK